MRSEGSIVIFARARWVFRGRCLCVREWSSMERAHGDVDDSGDFFGLCFYSPGRT